MSTIKFEKINEAAIQNFNATAAYLVTVDGKAICAVFTESTAKTKTDWAVVNDTNFGLYNVLVNDDLDALVDTFHSRKACTEYIIQIMDEWKKDEEAGAGASFYYGINESFMDALEEEIMELEEEEKAETKAEEPKEAAKALEYGTA